jgi:uncharacterized integral membrane protein
MWLIRLFLFIIAIAIPVGFILYNPSQRVDLYFPWSDYFNVPLTFVAFGAFIVGMLVIFLYSVFYFLKVGGDIREKNREIKKLELELSALRNRSLEDLEETNREQEE